MVERTDRVAILFWVNDNLSPKAKVTIRIRNGAGDVVKTFSLGWLATFHQFNSAISDWQCNLPVGNYTFSVYAVDQAGNQQAVLGGNTFKVKP